MGNNFDTFRKVLCGFSEVVINYKKNKLQGQVKIFPICTYVVSSIRGVWNERL